jgi:uncharacterized glyoxalase superfamily protein PhnB
MQTIVPMLRYDDARAAIRWLRDAFGFELRFAVPEAGPVVRHAQLRLGTNLVMLGSVRPGDGLCSPRSAGVATQAIYARVDDVDAHCARARAAGAEITAPPHDTDFGSRDYHARDLEGHPWVFGTLRHDAGA